MNRIKTMARIICKLMSLVVLALWLYVFFIFLRALILPTWDFDHKGLIRIVTVLIIGLLIALVLWIIGTPFAKRAKSVSFFVYALSVAYAVCLLAVLFGNADATRRFAHIHTHSLVPFRTTIEYFVAYKNHSIDRAIISENIIGNLLLFTPAGVLLPYYHTLLRKKRWFSAVMIVTLCTIEFMQFVTSRGSMDIDDVILNFTGSFIAFLAFWNKESLSYWKRIGAIENDSDTAFQ